MNLIQVLADNKDNFFTSSSIELVFHPQIQGRWNCNELSKFDRARSLILEASLQIKK
jgi:hypothetical protein